METPWTGLRRKCWNEHATTIATHTQVPNNSSIQDALGLLAGLLANPTFSNTASWADVQVPCHDPAHAHVAGPSFAHGQSAVLGFHVTFPKNPFLQAHPGPFLWFELVILHGAS